MKTTLLAVGAIAAVVLMPAAAPAQSRTSGKTHTRQIFVSVTGADGVAIAGLAAGDFAVRYAVDVQTASTDLKGLDVTVAREGVVVRISDRRRGQ